MRLKPGVSARGISPELLLGIMVLDAIYKNVTGADAVVTSLRDGTHHRASKHYRGDGADFRTIQASITPDTAERIRAEARAQLGKDYDIVVEGNHIHLEFDPKGPT